jgi:hypothetical protein
LGRVILLGAFGSPRGLYFGISSMTVVTPTTKLEAVNAVLAVIGESPVESLLDEFVDATIAANYIDQESRRVQLQGWSFNTDYEYTMTPDINGHILIPSGAAQVLVPSERQYVVRRDPADNEMKLYDRERNSFEFTAPKKVTIVWLYEYEDLPEALRQFIMVRSGRRFQDITEADPGLHRFTREDELQAWAAFQAFEASVGKYNVVQDSPTVLSARGRFR